jgi:hypothetical protein
LLARLSGGYDAGMKHRLIIACGALLAFVANPLVALAASQEPEREVVDARLEGYTSNVTLEGGSAALTWVLFIVLALLALGALFKDAKRTHLD